MRFMIIRKADADTEAAKMPSEALVTAMMKYNEEMIHAGVMLGGDGLQPSSRGARIKFSGGRPTITDGPFAEAKELIAGFTLIQVKSKEEALEWVKRWPAEDADGEVELELRQLYEADDFGDEFTPAIRRQEELLAERTRARAAEQGRGEETHSIRIHGLDDGPRGHETDRVAAERPGAVNPAIRPEPASRLNLEREP